MVTDINSTYHGEHLMKYIIVESLHCTPEINRLTIHQFKKLKIMLKNEQKFFKRKRNILKKGKMDASI